MWQHSSPSGVSVVRAQPQLPTAALLIMEHSQKFHAKLIFEQYVRI